MGCRGSSAGCGGLLIDWSTVNALLNGQEVLHAADRGRFWMRFLVLRRPLELSTESRRGGDLSEEQEVSDPLPFQGPNLTSLERRRCVWHRAPRRVVLCLFSGGRNFI
jgi:hypothetical protein